MGDIMRHFVAFGPIGLLAGVALLLMGHVYRMAQLSASFAWLEAEGHTRKDYAFAPSHLERARLCRSAFASLCAAAILMAFGTISAAIVVRNPTLGQTPTLVLVAIGLLAVCYAMVMMIMDARVELEMFRARYEHLRGEGAASSAPRAS